MRYRLRGQFQPSSLPTPPRASLFLKQQFVNHFLIFLFVFRVLLENARFFLFSSSTWSNFFFIQYSLFLIACVRP